MRPARAAGRRELGAPGFVFELRHVDRRSAARAARLVTPRGAVDLPAFMPVGTAATVKGLTVPMITETGTQIILGNTYHLALRPGADVIEQLGGLHAFCGWSGPILTDSGGFQIFSLAQRTVITDSGVVFRSHIDGTPIELTPERSVAIQEQLGSDIAMVLDHVPALPAEPAVVAAAARRTAQWAARCRRAHRRADQVQFGIVQGGLDPGLRRESARALTELDFAGYAIGGLSVGETPIEMYRVVQELCPELPMDQPRYLMGVGAPEDLLQGIAAGVDMFDCVMPTRNGRNALAFTDRGPLRLRNARHRADPRPLQDEIATPYAHHSRAYLHHLFQAGEMLGPMLLSVHNLAYYQRLMRQAREAIMADAFTEFMEERLRGWRECAADQ